MNDPAYNRPAQPARARKRGQGRRRAHVRLLRYLAIAVVVLGAAAVAASGTLAWRLSQGPIVLDRLTPFLASALSSGPNGVLVTIDHTVLSWSNGRLRLSAEGVHLNQPASDAHLTFHGME